MLSPGRLRLASNGGSAMHSKQHTETSHPRMAYSVEETAQALGIGRGLVFQLLREGQLKSIRLGKRRLIPASELAAFLDREQKKAG